MFSTYFELTIFLKSLSNPLTSPDNSPQSSVDVSVSTVFYRGAHSVPENLVFSSQDSVCFYVHLSAFSGAAECAFRPILSAPLSDSRYQTTRIHVPETSEILNIIFHVIYNMSCLKHSPSFNAIVTAIGRMPVYEISPKDYMAPSTPLHELLLHSMSHHPLEVYAIAAHYDVYDIAEAASAHLLSYPLNSISDEIVTQMGPVYLKRLLCLHANRLNALKYMIMTPPTFHAPTESCTYEEQKKLSRTWVMAAAHLVWDAQPSLSTHNLEAAFRPLQDQLSCPECCEIFSGRVREVAQGWSGVKDTI
ncbi:hypothetical protein BDZ94DRAFT_1312409 [Collybia nuda]|uniref:BTB domain-containing protein n=1 Tax=Collybia nuda TaxID=64659 RepID=A0A9P5XZ76_9AGAR|nr:hypothetical protein BDZ94DRAFT_1312409 [Collybia nuda]